MAEYRAESFRVDRVGDHGIAHFADLEFMEEAHTWDRKDESRFNAVKELIEGAMVQDPHLNDREIAKYFVVFPSEIVVSCYRTPESETDALPERYKAYKINKGFDGLEEIEVVPPCRLEHQIAAHESNLWEGSKTIGEYYKKKRSFFNLSHPHPNKKFE